MNKKGKNCNSVKTNEDKKYLNSPFNIMLNIYINNRVAYMKLDNEKVKGERSSYRQEVYEEISDETTIPVETIKNYSTGKSTPTQNTKLNEFQKFAEIIGCNVSELLPESKEEKRLKILDNIVFTNEMYNVLRHKKPLNLFGASIETTYIKILKDFILNTDFLSTYETEIDRTLCPLLHDKNSSDEFKNIPYDDYITLLHKNKIYTLDDMKSRTIRAFERQLDDFIQEQFDNDISG